MKYRIITLIGLAGSTLAVCFGGWDKFLKTLLLFMVQILLERYAYSEISGTFILI